MIARSTVPYLLLLFMGLAWGLSISFSKIAVSAGAHPFGLALWQVSVSSSMLLLASCLMARPPRLRGDVLRFGLICGTVGVGFPAIALFWSAKYLPAGIVAIAFASMPLFTYGLSALFGVEPREGRRLLGVVVGLGAISLLVLPEAALPDPSLAGWVFLGLAASLSMALENFYAGGYRPAGQTSLQLSTVRQLGGVVVLAPLAFATTTTVPLFAAWGPAQWAATGAGVLSGLAFTSLLFVIRTSGPVFASQSAYLVTLAGVAWGMVLFDERHSLYIWAALALTLLAILLVRPRAPRTLVPSAMEEKRRA